MAVGSLLMVTPRGSLELSSRPDDTKALLVTVGKLPLTDALVLSVVAMSFSALISFFFTASSSAGLPLLGDTDSTTDTSLACAAAEDDGDLFCFTCSCGLAKLEEEDVDLDLAAAFAAADSLKVHNTINPLDISYGHKSTSPLHLLQHGRELVFQLATFHALNLSLHCPAYKDQS